MKSHETKSKVLRTGPNWLLRGLLILSLGVHSIIFLHVSGIYGKKALTYIELSVEESEPPVRSIPRPRFRPKNAFRKTDVKRIKTPSRAIPHFKPIKMAPVDHRAPESLMESIALPEIPGTPNLASAHWEPAQVENIGTDFETPNSYLEMVRLRIEKYKNYPEKAKNRQLEGAVIVGFVIGGEGDVRSEKIVKTSGHRILDDAALNAVREASPFSRPPHRLFGGDVPLSITIVFELT